MKRFAESRLAAAALAAAWAAAAGPLVYTTIARAVTQGAIARAVGLEEATRACEADRENAECATRLAVAAERFGLTSLRLWDRAVELNRWDAAVLIQSGLAHEAEGETEKAERLLVEAAGRSRTWLPRWSLANFYARQGRPDEVAKWARLALERGYGERAPLFGLCRSAGVSHDKILTAVLGERDIAGIEGYMGYLRAQAVAEAAEPLARAADMLLNAYGQARLSRANADELALAADWLVVQDQQERGWTIWQRLREQGGMGDVPGAVGGVLCDAGFTDQAMAAPGFGWEMTKAEGVQILAGSPPGMAKIELTGGQPESVTLLSQRVKLGGGGRWVLGFEAAVNGDQPADGHFLWVLAMESERGEEAARGWKSESDWKGVGVSWDVEDGFWRLSLVYRRPLGSARWSGELRIRNLSLRREGANR